MAINNDKIDDAALALLYLTLHDDHRAWKRFDWEGLERAKTLFEELFED